MTQYSIDGGHLSPPNPEFTFTWNQQTKVFEPNVAVWTDWSRSCAWPDGDPAPILPPDCDPDDPDWPDCLGSFMDESAGRGAAFKSKPKRAIHEMRGRRGAKLFDSVCRGQPGQLCAACNWTVTYTVGTPGYLGNDPTVDPAEDEQDIYYYCVDSPNTRTPDLLTPIHYRGNDPSPQELSAALGNDLMRAICWHESSWRQFTKTIGGKPLKNPTSPDWGVMQINNAAPIELWDWQANVTRGLALYAEKVAAATTYLNAHPPYSEDMLRNESIQRYNGGTYYTWDTTASQWRATPANNYVATILNVLNTKPWPKSTPVEEIAIA
jgi:hypothetical protein